MLQQHQHFPPEDDTEMVAKGWRAELVPVNTLNNDSIRDSIRAMYENGGRDKLNEDILDSDSPVTGLYQQNVTNKTGITPEQFIERIGDDSHLVGNPDNDNPNGGIDSHFATHWENEVLRGAVRIIPAYDREFNGKRYSICHYMDGMVVPDSTGSMSWIYTKWAWRSVKDMIHGAGYDGYNFAGIEGSRIVEHKLRQLQADEFNELMVDNEIEYTSHIEDGTKGITVWHYYR